MDEYDRQRFIEFWERRRAQGQWPYVAREALIMALILVVVAIVIDLFDHSFSAALTENLTVGRLLFKIVLSFAYGLFMWYRHEKLYHKYK